MPTLARTEHITQSFYAWEERGRGWTLADYPVAFEPPYRPFFLLPESGVTGTRPASLDDGKRSTWLSTAAENVKRWFGGSLTAEEPEAPFVEQAPYPIELDPAPFTFGIRMPLDFTFGTEQMRQLLLALSSCIQPMGFEFVGGGGRVHFQMSCHDVDRETILATLEGIVPDIVPVENDDHLMEEWDFGRHSVIVDCALAREFFLPIKAGKLFGVDPYIPLVSALARAKEDECACMQILFQRVINPWERSILHAVQAGGGLIDDAPEFGPLAKEKTESPLFAAVLRIATQSDTDADAWKLARSLQGFLLQFSRSGSNEFIPLANDEYPDTDHENALLARVSYRSGMLLSANELLGLAHFPDASVTHPALVRLKHRTKAAPKEAVGHKLKLGTNEHRGTETTVTLAAESRMAHMHVVGASGTGKSSFLLSLIKQDIDNGESLAVLDPHGDLTEDILGRIPSSREKQVIVFDPADGEFPIGFNILSAGSEQEKTLLASDLTGIFARLSTSWGDVMNTVLGQAVLAILESEIGGTLLDLRRFLVDDGFRTTYLKTISDEDIRYFWTKEFPTIGTKAIGPIITRLNMFLRSKLVRHIVGQKEAKLHLGEVMDKGPTILLVKLSQGMIGEENAALLGSLFVSKFHQHALARQSVVKAKRRPFYLYADECQHFVTPSLEALHGEGRKYALGMTLAHQTLAQIERMPSVAAAILGNAYTRVVFRVGSSDARKLAEGFSFFERDDIESLGRGQAIVRIGGSGNDCNLATIPVPPVPPKEAEARMAAAIAHSRTAYAMPLAELKERFAEWYPPDEEPPEPPSAKGKKRPAAEPEQKKIAPPSKVPAQEPVPTPVTTAPDVTAEVGRPAEAELPERPEAPPPKKPRPVPPDLPEQGRGGQEHKYCQQIIKRLAEERGFRATIEDAAGGGRADVVLKKDRMTVACEISVTTTADQEVANLLKCKQAGFDHILFVCKDNRKRTKVESTLAEALGDVKNIVFIAPKDIPMALERIDPTPKTTETTIRGYKVKTTRTMLSAEEGAAKQKAVAEVIARAISKRKKT